MAGFTPIYGFPYPEATDLVADYPALGQDLAEDIEAVLPTLGGLSSATPTSIANSGGLASLSGNTVTFTGVSSVSLNGCFTGDMDNYRVMTNYVTSTTAVMNLRFRASAADNTAAVYQIRGGDQGGFTSAAVSDQTSAAVATSYAGGNTAVIDVCNPYSAQYTLCPFITMGGTVAVVALSRFGALAHLSTSSFDGLSLYMASGNMTGTVSVYGFKK
jgi:hypothetical protein